VAAGGRIAVEVFMKPVFKLLAATVLVILIAGCASQQEAPEGEEAEEPATEQATQQEPTQATEEQAAEPSILAQPGIAGFQTQAGAAFESQTMVTLPTGGPPEGRLIPTSSSDDVTLYVTRDGSVPSADNNWGGPIDPRNPQLISRPLEGVASYRVVAEYEGGYSEPFTLTVIWEHEESPQLPAPVFVVDGREVSGSITIPVSQGEDPAAQLQISCAYAAATLYIARDGSEPTVDEYWRSQTCQGTYIWSPEPTVAHYRVIAVWQGERSPVASLNVEWVAER
jgi:hypothetical protein